MRRLTPHASFFQKEHELLLMRNVSRTYSTEADVIKAVRSFSLEVESGALVVVMGPSGSGKSTLLSIAGGLQPPDDGSVSVAGVNLATLSEPELYAHRRQHIGYVFQDFNLVQMLTAVENVALSDELGGVPRRRAHHSAADALTRVGLADQLDRFPDTLSGGQQQRVAIARAICGRGQRLLLADEPTGALDSATADQVMDLIVRLVGSGCTGVIATHDPRVAARADRVVEMVDGKLVAASDLVGQPT